MQDFHIIEATETIETPLAPQRVEGSEFIVHRTSCYRQACFFWGGGRALVCIGVNCPSFGRTVLLDALSFCNWVEPGF